jgi:RNA polymerase sigma-70 factor (ECF subfamily)
MALSAAPALELDLAGALLATLNRALRDAVLARDGSGRAGGRSVREQAVAIEDQADSADAADRADIQATLGGDGSAFARLIARHQQAVARHLLKFARDAGTHELLVQDAFVEAWTSLAGYRGRSPLQPWLLAIATRVGYRHWKAQARRRNELALDELPEGLADELTRLEAAAPTSSGSISEAPADEAREAAELVHRLLERLPPRDRLVITLLHLSGHSVAQTAELTGWSRTMVKVQAFRARAKLRALIDEGDQP